ncbi:MAG: archaeoflavoprotein AfpA [Candidatus Bathyarchaeota archaeon]|nr:MAG: archaeoflavoprotein AfpA [Candidatus Bathyarchaeota archaeon]
MKIAWGITGSGDRLAESIDLAKSLQKRYGLDIDIILSKAGEMVVTWYKLVGSLKQNFRVFIESTPNTPFLIGPLQLGKYDFLLICPATANTTAKIAHGIADSLLSNCVAQAMKAGIPVFIFPVDQKAGKVETLLPNKKKLTLYMRDVDLENAEKLRHMNGIAVLSSPSEIESAILEFSEEKKRKSMSIEKKKLSKTRDSSVR